MTVIYTYLLILLIMSVLTFFTWGWDKSAAMDRRWRIPERTLLIMVLLGGAVGGAMGMAFFHHKTRKTLFQSVLWVAGALQLLLFILLLYFNG